MAEKPLKERSIEELRKGLEQGRFGDNTKVLVERILRERDRAGGTRRPVGSQANARRNFAGGRVRPAVRPVEPPIEVEEPGAEETFRQIRSAITTHVPAGDERARLLTKVTALETTYGTNRFYNAVEEFLTLAEMHTTGHLSVLPALIALL